VKSSLAVIAAFCLYCAADAGAQMPTGPLPGEIRAFAVDGADAAAIMELHQAGWLEAAGQLLSVNDFPAAFKMIRRRWTPKKASSDKFALPDLRKLSRSPGEVDSRTAELLGGDLVSGGRTLRNAPTRLLYCVYVGVDASKLDATTGRLAAPR
jgi:tail collar domain